MLDAARDVAVLARAYAQFDRPAVAFVFRIDDNLNAFDESAYAGIVNCVVLKLGQPELAARDGARYRVADVELRRHLRIAAGIEIAAHQPVDKGRHFDFDGLYVVRLQIVLGGELQGAGECGVVAAATRKFLDAEIAILETAAEAVEQACGIAFLVQLE